MNYALQPGRKHDQLHRLHVTLQGILARTRGLLGVSGGYKELMVKGLKLAFQSLAFASAR
jgi:hypothetical protein